MQRFRSVPHTYRPFPSVSNRREGHFHGRTGNLTERSHFCQTGPKESVKRVKRAERKKKETFVCIGERSRGTVKS